MVDSQGGRNRVVLRSWGTLPAGSPREAALLEVMLAVFVCPWVFRAEPSRT